MLLLQTIIQQYIVSFPNQPLISSFFHGLDPYTVSFKSLKGSPHGLLSK